MNTIRCIFCSAVLACLPGITPVQARVWISEFVSSNQDGLLDHDGDSEDWLELHNDGTGEVSLGGWSLTDDASDLRKWIIPDVSIPAGGYLVIFASGENLRIPGEELHTNFSLRQSGEYLALVRPDGVTVEHGYGPEYPGQFEDVSFGLNQTGETTTVVVPQGTPGRAGVPASADDFAAAFAGWNSELDGNFTGPAWREVSSAVGMDRNEVYGDWLGEGA
ncbi:MAG: lamin tail domain-containing protein, partial [Akkermansiaceae bacterium]|nr:lamin tail domain-containing protein [Akkermansiaceae bacterium]